MRLILFLTAAIVYGDKFPSDKAILGNSTDLYLSENLHRNKRWIKEVIQYAPVLIDLFTDDGVDNLAGSISTFTISIQDDFGSISALDQDKLTRRWKIS